MSLFIIMALLFLAYSWQSSLCHGPCASMIRGDTWQLVTSSNDWSWRQRSVYPKAKRVVPHSIKYVAVLNPAEYSEIPRTWLLHIPEHSRRESVALNGGVDPNHRPSRSRTAGISPRHPAIGAPAGSACSRRWSGRSPSVFGGSSCRLPFLTDTITRGRAAPCRAMGRPVGLVLRTGHSLARGRAKGVVALGRQPRMCNDGVARMGWS